MAGLKVAKQVIDMARAARMKRAKAQGFDTDQVYYHGTTADRKEFSNESEKRPFLTTSKERANGYAGEEGGNVMPVYLRMSNPQRASEYSNIYHDAAYSKEGRRLLEEEGVDGVIDIPNSWDDISRRSGGDTATPFNTNDIRSVNAAFDPAKADSPNLMAQVAGMAPAAGLAGLGAAALTPEQALASPYSASEYLAAGNQPMQPQAIPARFPLMHKAANMLGGYQDPTGMIVNTDGLADYLRQFGEPGMLGQKLGAAFGAQPF